MIKIKHFYKKRKKKKKRQGPCRVVFGRRIIYQGKPEAPTASVYKKRVIRLLKIIDIFQVT